MNLVGNKDLRHEYHDFQTHVIAPNPERLELLTHKFDW